MVSLVDYARSLLPTGSCPWLAGEKMPPFHPLVVQIWPYRAATPVFWWQRQLWCWSHCMLMDCAWLLYASLKPELPTLRCFPGASSCILQGCHRLKSSQPSQFCGAPMGSPLCLCFENVRSASPARLWRCRHWLQKNGLLTVSCGCWMVFWHIEKIVHRTTNQDICQQIRGSLLC